MKVSYQGEPGAYSEDAVREVFPGGEAVPCETVRAAFGKVTGGDVDFGVVPLENSQAGSINETYDLLGRDEHELKIVGEVIVRVDHALLGLPGAIVEGLERIFSHPQALAQCDEFLAGLSADIVPVLDTAGAARRVAEEGDPKQGAIASTRAAELLGVEVLAERIQNYDDNFTKFAVIGSSDPGFEPANKTSIVFAVADRPGSLFACLEPYAKRDINLTKLESRPRPGAPFEYLFYMDLEAAAEEPGTQEVLDEMRRHSSMLKILGSYPRWNEGR
ncbi:MAG: prephenate dehydratase [Actinomycetota bacterium]